MRKTLVLGDWEKSLQEQVTQLADVMGKQLLATRQQQGLDVPFYTSLYEMALNLGYYFDVDQQQLPKAALMPIKECFANAARKALGSPKYLYCEGYAVSEKVGIALPHAWNLDTHTGLAVDFTASWHGKGKAYLGIVFSTEYLIDQLLQYKVYGLLDNWKIAEQVLSTGLPNDAWYTLEQLEERYG